MSKAGENEKKFKQLISDRFGTGLLQGSQTYKNYDADVSISVDDMIEIDGKRILFEIDSGNYAKLLVGQYVLLNQIIEDQENVLFVIVHYYKQYNDERTRKNLQFINESLYKSKGIPFKVFTAESFQGEINQYRNIEEFVAAKFSL
ncbi:hypothetical protein [Ureibacillus thermosphaericus]|uniref:mRNA-degrading endonuclease RelE of RelBE toxin-antitoxin system n=1 Tax=Ureibacillus thermosphaericus TaxID=51173 RepID=A0A840PT87_URETH|nr:hypothetical protein [Ureibacillus thermosphaericus]MBB5149100.1 mRNA-degrading endonuclease RelE of RelBE toxin-antitoxin system [Ureibacillus thermosphaericus]NKZ31864.1 hypothetical protein [Ureibacillus thermosphaericus]